MSKREYAQLGKDWLAAKAKEECVRTLAKGKTTIELAQIFRRGRGAILSRLRKLKDEQ